MSANGTNEWKSNLVIGVIAGVLSAFVVAAIVYLFQQFRLALDHEIIIRPSVAFADLSILCLLLFPWSFRLSKRLQQNLRTGSLYGLKEFICDITKWGLPLLITACLVYVSTPYMRIAPTACGNPITVGGTWRNIPFQFKAQRLSVEFDAVPNARVDTVFGLANGDQQGYNGYSCLVRFMDDGRIQIWSGPEDNYDVDRAMSYIPGTRYHFRIVGDVDRKECSAYVSQGDSLNEHYLGTQSFRVPSDYLNTFGVRMDAPKLLPNQPTGSLVVDICRLKFLPFGLQSRTP